MTLKQNEFILTRLPLDCEPTLLGGLQGADQQYRGLNGLHVRRYGEQLIGHHDRVDPREDLAGHLLVDAPKETAFGVGVAAACSAVLIGKPHVAIPAGIVAGLATWVLSSFVEPYYR